MSEVAKIVDKQSPLRQAGQVQAQTQEQEPRKCGQKAYSKMTAEELAIAKAKRAVAIEKAKATRAAREEQQQREQFKLGDGIDVSRIGGLGVGYPPPIARSSSGGNASSSNGIKHHNSVTHPQRAELKLHKSGVITSVLITLAETTSSRYCHEVNFRSVLQKYGITKDKEKGYGKWIEIDAQKQLKAAQKAAINAVASTSSPDGKDLSTVPDSVSPSTSSPDALPPAPPISDIRHKRDNPYDNIIEKLERKYIFKQQIVSPEKSNDGHSPGSGGGGQVKKRSKFADHRDTYDESDPFIDDSELIDEIEKTVRTKVLKTKTDGFFVSSGHLDVVIGSSGIKRQPDDDTNPPVNDIAVKKKRFAGTSSDISAAINAPLTSPAADVDAAAPSTVLISHVQDLSSSSTSSSSQLTVNVDVSAGADDKLESIASPGPLVGGGDVISPTASEKKKQVKPKADKPLWNPSQEAIAALGLYKKKVDDYISLNNTGITKPQKNVYPRALDKDLCEVDKVIVKHHKNHARYSGYHETLCEIVGALHTDFHISTAVMKAAIKRVNAAEKASNTRKKYEVMFTALEQEMKSNIETAPPEAEQIKAAIAAREKSKARKADKVSASSSENKKNDAEVEKGKKDKEKEDVEDVSVVIYTLQLKWTPSLRSNLYALEEQCHRYIQDENAWRSLLQSSDKKMMEKEEDGDPIVEKEAVDEMFNKVQSFCPLSCMHTDIKYFKTVITVEKNRLRRLEAKEKELKEKEKQAASNAQSLSSATSAGGSNGVSVVNIELEKKLEIEKLAKATAIKDAIAASALAHTSSPNLKVGRVLSSENSE